MHDFDAVRRKSMVFKGLRALNVGSGLAGITRVRQAKILRLWVVKRIYPNYFGFPICSTRNRCSNQGNLLIVAPFRSARVGLK